jgi:2-keto-4-pentenoate hydratase/2-oxohepta-3-ene-1,7-dioic acid hydratase in catechol pathway
VETAFDYVQGYTVVNDVTNVDRNALDEKTFDGKGGQGYTPMGPRIETELEDPQQVAITVIVSGLVKAESGTFNVPSTVAESIVYVARWVPLEPGHVIMSGSPNTFVAVTPGRRGRDHAVPDRLTQQPCHLTKILREMRTP